MKKDNPKMDALMREAGLNNQCNIALNEFTNSVSSTLKKMKA